MTFWGGGVDTQHVPPFGAPQDVWDEVKHRISARFPSTTASAVSRQLISPANQRS
jgi:hypothetical protein